MSTDANGDNGDTESLAEHLARWPDSTTLGEVRAWLRERARDGAPCPACRRTVRVYRRVLNAGMAYALLVMFRAHRCEWQDKTDTLRGVGAAARDEPLLRYWGLLQEDERPREDGGRSGWWRVTELGARFARGAAEVPRYALFYNRKLLRLDEADGRFTVREALGERFSYDELMAEVGDEDPPL